MPAREPTARQGIRLAALGGSAALAAGALLVGGVLAGSLTASAASSSTGASAATSQSRAAAGKASTQQSRATFPAHGTPAHENLEKPVTGSAADKARAAAVKAVGSGTAGEVTTDVSANGYEVTVTRSDGSKVEAHLDQSFNPDDRGRLGTDRSATGRSRAGPVRLPVLDATT